MLARLLITHKLLLRATLGWLAAALVVLLGPAAALAAPNPAPTARPIMGPKATLVAFSDQDPWTLQVSGFDVAGVQSVTYFVRDAAKRWHTVGPVTAAPFAADLDWWTWNDGGQIVVTSHVQMWSGGRGRLVKDPGGWTSVDGRSLDPGGRLETLANSDGSLGARYKPDRGGTRIAEVQFWLRVGGHWSQVAEAAQLGANGSFEVPTISGTSSGSWRSNDTAMSVHVVWPGGRQVVDPTPWAWGDHAVGPPTPAPTPVATPSAAPAATPTPTPAPVEAPRAATPPPAAAPPQPAPPPTQPPAAPAGCYPLTNSGGCYKPGEFCRTSDRGATGRTASGEAIVCRDNNGWRWEPA